MELHLHPDNVVIIRDGDNVLYVDTPENFANDYGEEIETVEGWNERLYRPGIMNRLCNGFTDSTSSDTWPQGDDILSSVSSIVSSKQARMEALYEGME